MELNESHLTLREIDTGGRTGIDTICVFSPDSEFCKHIPRETIVFELKKASGELIRHGNSAILSLKLSFSDEVEKFVFERIRVELIRSPSSQIKPLREPEESFDISFFLDVDMVETLDQRKKLLEYVNAFPDKMRQATTRGKMRLTNLIRNEAASFKLG
ncbi:MAG: hypothetical protein ACXAEI_03345 [Candidatus Hodarchaeales archaeon]|jgi:hypothetical protein